MAATTDETGQKLIPLLVELEEAGKPFLLFPILGLYCVSFIPWTMPRGTAPSAFRSADEILQVGYTGGKGHDHDAFFKGMHLQAACLGIPYPEGSLSWHAFHTAANHAYVSLISQISQQIAPQPTRSYIALFLQSAA